MVGRPDVLNTDILILGGGGAGVMAALHATDGPSPPAVTIAVKGLVAKSGCTRMVQGGFNAVLDPRDSVDLHFRDTVEAGGFLNDQDLVWILVTRAPRMIAELENRYGVFFDRSADGTIHQKPFAGQSFDRTVHRGDLTGIDIMERLRDALLVRPTVSLLEDHRAVALTKNREGTRVVGALLLDMREGAFLFVRARAVLLATGGGPTFYRMATPSREKSMDGIVLAYEAGARLVDMEMVQFHPTGLVCPGSELNGAVVEEGLRGSGAYLLNGLGERFMARYDPRRMERSTRDVVARAEYLEIAQGRGTPHGGVWIDISHLGAARVEELFPGMVERTRMAGFDLATGPVEVCPSAHFIMGGVRIDAQCRTSLQGLYAAGEDAGGVQGANRLGGNGVAESLVFGALAGDVMREEIVGIPHLEPDWAEVRQAQACVEAPLERESGEDVYTVLDELRSLMWDKVGVVRHGTGLREACVHLEELRTRVSRVRVHGNRCMNLEWMHALNLRSLHQAATLVAASALVREESRGAHYRTDFPDQDSFPYNVLVVKGDKGSPLFIREPARLTRMAPEEAHI